MRYTGYICDTCESPIPKDEPVYEESVRVRGGEGDRAIDASVKRDLCGRCAEFLASKFPVKTPSKPRAAKASKAAATAAPSAPVMATPSL